MAWVNEDTNDDSSRAQGLSCSLIVNVRKSRNEKRKVCIFVFVHVQYLIKVHKNSKYLQNLVNDTKWSINHPIPPLQSSRSSYKL